MDGDVEITPGLWLRYGCDAHLLGSSLRERFVPLSIDAETRAFTAHALAHPAGSVRSQLYAAARRVMSDYDAYGLLGMYGMHLLSTGQVRSLLGAEHVGGRLLDVGAGDGAVTLQLAPLFDAVSATESSRVLRYRLRRRGVKVIDHDLSRSPLPSADVSVIACLNVIDRSVRPRSLLMHLRTMLGPQARLLLSVPLPLAPHVHVGAATVDPEESLPRSEEVWELDARHVVDELLTPLGFVVDRLARVPYLSRGDAHTPLYVLDAAVFVLRAAPAI